MQKYSYEEQKYFIEEFYRSGISQHAFSKQHNITKSTLSYWLRKKHNSSTFVNITDSLKDAHKYSTDITLVIKDAVKIQLPRNYDDALLLRVLRTLGVSV